jgi:exopolyphosphatase/guanosine-5'-triphosphate,3'-diphosphate pyrophosphatase
MLELRRKPAARIVRPEDEKSAQIGVLDIGSNSVRLIIYRREGRAFWPILNEKLLAGLGRGVAETGRLSPEGVEMALSTLRRFRLITEARGVTELLAFATAAVREAQDGPEFIARIGRECGIDVEVLSGEEEGRLSALGVMAGGADNGLVGDLGGSSVELCPLQDGQPLAGVTLKLGPLAVLGRGANASALRAMINAELDSARALFSRTGKDFYAVGGAWRNLARVDMTLRDYPLHVLHHYEMSRAQARRTATFVASQSAQSLGELQGVSSRRVALLPYAALLLECILEHGAFERVVISAYGVREGALFDRMPEEIQARDPLLAGAAAYARRLAPASDIGAPLADWVEPVFTDQLLKRETLLRRAAALLADIGSVMHPDHRAELAADQVLYSPIAGMDHEERAFLATALFHRYAGPAEPPEDFEARHMAPPETLERARSLGLALRLGCVISGRTPALLGLTAIAAKDGMLVLNVSGEGEALATEQAEKRLRQLASALGLKPQILAQGAGGDVT